jgi:iron(III) transport system substrate-binding protein
VTVARVLIFLALAVILGIPFAMRPATKGDRAAGVPTLVIVTPHVQQIRRELGAGFARWHEGHFGAAAQIDWRTPGGTSEIVKQLEAQYQAAMKGGRYELSWPGEDHSKAPTVVMAPGTIGFDLMLGGGSYDHGRVRQGVRVRIAIDGERRDITVPMSEPAGFGQARLDEWYGPNKIGAQQLYDPEQYWLGTALSSFGIVYSRDVLQKLGLPEPRSFADLTDARYLGWIALADPRQSGSITTAFEAILNNYGWEKGWRALREMTGNARYFTNSSTKPPIDISAGEAAAGLAIDFYGRSQGQSILLPGESPEQSRVAYVDPAGEVYIDADPVSILRGGPHPELARRFVEYMLTEEAQALWQFPARARGGAGFPPAMAGQRPAPPGPEQYELRRMPVRRVMYEKYLPYFIDRVDPFELVADVAPRGWRAAIGLMMGAFAIDIADEQRAAWAALNRARADTAFPRERLVEMERLFYAWPVTAVKGQELEFTPENFKAVREAWRDPREQGRLKVEYTRFFRGNYRRIVELSRAGVVR